MTVLKTSTLMNAHGDIRMGWFFEEVQLSYDALTVEVGFNDFPIGIVVEKL